MPQLPSIFNAHEPTKIDFLKSEGTLEAENRFPEPGRWWNCERKDYCEAFYCAQTQIDNLTYAGADPATGTFTVTVTPITTQHGPASADGMKPATITYVTPPGLPTPGPQALADVILGIIAASESSANLFTEQDVVEWSRFRSYVQLRPVDGEPLQIEAVAVQSGQTFRIEATVPGANTVVISSVQVVGDGTAKAGLYVAIDRTKGTNGFNDIGQMFVKQVAGSTPVADIVGPVYLGANTQPLLPGYVYREYKQDSMLSVAHYGKICAYGEEAIPASAIKSSPYVRKVLDGNCEPGLVATQATAEAGATAGVLTLTPVAADSTLYEFDVIVDGETIGTVSYTSSAAPATADEIAGAYREQLLAINSAYKADTGVNAYTLDAAFGSPVVLTGRADGNSIALTPTTANVGNNGIVATTPAVSTHILFTRDKIAAASLRPGSVPVEVPYP